MPINVQFLRVITATALVAMFSPVHAFGLDAGFRSNMTESEALGLLRVQFELVSPFSSAQAGVSSYIATSSGSPGYAAIGLCDARLTSYESSVSGDFPAFVRLVERQVLESGAGKYTASTSETRVGVWSRIAFVWGLGQDVKTISMNRVGTQSAEVTVRYESPSNCR